MVILEEIMRGVAILCLFFAVCAVSRAQQVADTLFTPSIKDPAYAKGSGPVITIDEAHYNFHTANGRFRPFARLMELDGYKTRKGTEKLSKESLAQTKILVISNALHERNTEEWTLPTPSAFTDDEIAAVVAWVNGGGSLFLIADHMPFPGNNEKLAAAFGFKFYNGFAIDTTQKGPPDFFTTKNKRLVSHPLTAGIDKIATFTGQAFDIPPGAEPLLKVDEKFKLWMPDTAWIFDKTTRKMSAAGKTQGAVMKVRSGRLVIFGEAAMFSAQTAGGKTKVGFNSSLADRNAEFLLRLIHWLDKG